MNFVNQIIEVWETSNNEDLQQVAHIGVNVEPIALAVFRVLKRLRAILLPPDPQITVQERNGIIAARFAAGESQAALALAFGISYQRVYQIIRGKYH